MKLQSMCVYRYVLFLCLYECTDTLFPDDVIHQRHGNWATSTAVT